MKRHDLSQLFGDMGRDDLAKLTDDIKRHGLNHPILTWQGQILDGWHRYQACKAAGVEPRFQDFSGDDVKAVRLVMQENSLRRHLVEGARIVISKKVLGWHQARASIGRRTNSPQEPFKSLPITNRQIAEASGTSINTVKRHNNVESNAPSLLPMVNRGEIGLKTAERLVQKIEAEVLEKATPAQIQALKQSVNDQNETLLAEVRNSAKRLRDACTKLSTRKLTPDECEQILQISLDVKLTGNSFASLLDTSRRSLAETER